MRAGGVDSKMHQVMSWAGDQTVDWTRSDGLPSSIVSALSLATSGSGWLVYIISSQESLSFLTLINKVDLDDSQKELKIRESNGV